MKALFRSIALLTLALTALSGCGSDGNMGPTEVNDVNGYLGALPAWSEFSPEKPSEDVPIGDPSDPDIFTVGATEYSCTTTPYSITDTPDRLATFNPDSEIMWLGALLQGKGHRDGLGSLAELPIRQRAPIKVFTDLLTEANAETVENPDAQSISTAIGKLIEQAEAAGHNAGSKISFDMKQTHSLQQAAIFLGFSARYMSTQVEGELSYEQEREENTLTAYFVQQMFTTSMVLPQTPGDVFSDDFTAARMQEQVDLGRMGPDNLPTFISNIVWGRMLMLTMTSTHSY
ncbi:MAG: hypothetical protein HKN12_12135, partial [Gemmatimonadetes bacterium]|nr:hypothetical protein [Gemmatimonadota bacterium]